MDSFELNKIFGAILGTVLLVMGLGIVSEGIFHSEAPKVPGYAVDVAEVETSTEQAEKPAEPDIAELLVSASVDAGQAVTKKCASCHSFDEGGANKVGPNLWNLINSAPAARSGFKYSGSMIAFAESNKWTYENLNAFLAKPKKFIDGTTMGFAGLKKPEDRANLIVYLRSLSSDPAPLPTSGEAPAEEVMEEKPAEASAMEDKPAETPKMDESPTVEVTEEPAAETESAN